MTHWTTIGKSTDALRAAAHPLTGAMADYDPLLERIGDAPLVLLGEATHGSREFYHVRAEITRRLIEEKGFNAVAVEADWPDAYRVNRFVRGRGGDRTARAALGDFRRFPTWMWRNTDVLDFVGWLRQYNLARPESQRVGFYGLDLYSLYSSIAAVIEYLEGVDPDAAARARQRYACFDHAEHSEQAYGYGVSLDLRESCEEKAIEQLLELRRTAAEILQRDGMAAEEEQFFAEQNARVVAGAEEYYRGMFGRRVNTWNLRDRHMADTLASLMEHLTRTAGRAKVAVWEHNSHLGDARATEMSEDGEWNVGQLARERFEDQAVLVGFTTYGGTVTAASDWDGPAERMRVRPALDESYEALLHEVGLDRFLLLMNDPQVARALAGPQLERAIGVVYRPQTERMSHYFYSTLPRQFDAVLHFDQTHAVEPLDRTSHGDESEPPETYPSGL